ncbi:hypothetical protein SEMRO_2567_G331480.1 [Seminavis robusta]|uniref:Uncharacterized protein n=1 Tax=Seminavis robusta TaxID=568900 RepID=A0A9N8F0B7_9STRA|nr:hypothetical protein SEMRO_2567_G331480.1 [Seminavis robusta]|eukprot:Sro2567_g331480.1 n/a (216) ;mRNA; r:4047-4694
MPLSKEAFDSFVSQNGHNFPYNCVKRTRSSFITKWVFFNGRGRGDDALFRPTSVYALPASCVSLKQLQELIVSKVAVPFPPEHCEVMDCMFWWGACMDNGWYQQVLGFIAFDLKPRGYQAGESTRSSLFHYCIYMLMRKKAFPCHNTDALLAHWNKLYYDYIYRSTGSFFSAATESIRVMEYAIMWGINAPFPTASDSDNEGGESLPDTVVSADE